MTHAHLRRILAPLWLAFAAGAIYLALFHRELVIDRLRAASGASMLAGGALYLLLGCLRGFTLIPATSLVLMGILFFPPGPLFVLTLVGILVSSASRNALLRNSPEIDSRHVDGLSTSLYSLLEIGVTSPKGLTQPLPGL